MKQQQSFGWPLERGECKKCEVGGEEYNLLVKEHECRRCHSSACSKCLTKAEYFGVEKSSIVLLKDKVCTFCQQDMAFNQKLVEGQQLRFGRSSSLGQAWRARVAGDERILRQYEERLNKPCPEFKKYKESDSMRHLWAGLNPSLLDLVARSRREMEVSEMETAVERVLQAVLAKNQESQFRPRLLQLVAYFLVFGDEPLAYRCVNSLIQIMGRQKERIAKHSLKSVIRDDISGSGRLDKNESAEIGKVLDSFGDQIISKFTINTFRSEISVFVVNETLHSQNYYETRMGIGAALLDMVHKLIPHEKKTTKLMALVRNPPKNFYSFYSSMVSRQYSFFTLSKQVPHREPRAKSLCQPSSPALESKFRVSTMSLRQQNQQDQDAFKLDTSSFPTDIDSPRHKSEVSNENAQIQQQQQLEDLKISCSLKDQRIKQLESLLEKLRRQLAQARSAGQPGQQGSGLMLQAELQGLKLQNLALRDQVVKQGKQNSFYLAKITELSKLLIEYTSSEVLQLE